MTIITYQHLGWSLQIQLQSEEDKRETKNGWVSNEVMEVCDEEW